MDTRSEWNDRRSACRPRLQPGARRDVPQHTGISLCEGEIPRSAIRHTGAVPPLGEGCRACGSSNHAGLFVRGCPQLQRHAIGGTHTDQTDPRELEIADDSARGRCSRIPRARRTSRRNPRCADGRSQPLRLRGGRRPLRGVPELRGGPRVADSQDSSCARSGDRRVRIHTGRPGPGAVSSSRVAPLMPDSMTVESNSASSEPVGRSVRSSRGRSRRISAARY